MQDEVGDRLEVLLAEVHRTADPALAARVDELLEELVALYGGGLARVIAILAEDGVYTSALQRRLVEDPLVSALLALHHLHPADVRDRVEGALEAARPYLASHGGSVSLVAVEGAVARVRLEGTCESCASSAATLRGLIDRAVQEAAPEIGRVEVVTAEATPPLIQLRRPPSPPGAP